MTFVLIAAALLAAAPAQEDVEARLQAGRSALAARNYDVAKQEFTAVLRDHPGNSIAQLNLGIIALVQNDPVAGLRHFSSIPNDPRALIGKLDCELRLKQLDEARATAKQLDPITAQNLAASAHIGGLLAAAGEHEAALPFLRRAKDTVAPNVLGLAEEKAGNLRAAAAAFAEAVQREPTNEEFRLDHAATLLNVGDVEGSIKAFQAAAQAFPRSARLRLGLGSALYLAGDHRGAAQALLEAVRLEPGPGAFDLLGKAFEAAGDLQGQIQTEFEKYLANDPQDATAYAQYAAILQMTAGDVAATRQALRRALQLNPKLAAAHLQLGTLEQTAGNTEAAVEAYERAAALDPDNATVHYKLAVAYRRLGASDKARSAMRQFQRLKSQQKP